MSRSNESVTTLLKLEFALPSVEVDVSNDQVIDQPRDSFMRNYLVMFWHCSSCIFPNLVHQQTIILISSEDFGCLTYFENFAGNHLGTC